jgi:beta-lactamase regulating signal transducer with metallopeptidase domain
MTSLQLWLTPDVTRAVALAILHFLWQGVALAALASAAMALSRNAATRYAIAVAVMALMFAAPALTFVVLHQRAAASAASGTDGHAGSANTMASDSLPARVSTRGVPQRSSIPTSPGYLSWLVEAWLAGVALLSLRPAAGFFALQRLRRMQATPVSELIRARCLSLQNTLGVRRLIRYCESVELKTPAVVGWFRPVVFLPLCAISGLSVDQLDAIVAHELAHIKRLDAFVNLFQIATETLLFYHPAVWWLSSRIRAERENCCDDVAIAVCGNATAYARALASMAESHAAPAMAMAANRSPLVARVARILGAAKSQAGIRGASLFASALCLSLSLLAGHALFGANQTADAPPRPPIPAETPASPTTPQSPDAVIVIHGSPAAPLAPLTPTSELPRSPQPAPIPEVAITAVTAIDDQDAPAPEKAPLAQVNPKSSYIESLKAAGLINLDIDQIIALKIQGVTSDYVRSLIAAGVKPDADEIVAFKIQGVTSDYLKGLSDAGVKVAIDEALAMKIQGVTPEYIRELRISVPDIASDDILAMKIQGVSPDYIRELRASFPNIASDNILAMKVQGVTPEYAKELRDVTGLKLDADELIAMKVQGVTAAYIRDMKALGLQLDADTIIGMKVQGVTPEYAKSLQSAGLHFDADELIGAKIQGITPEFIAQARSHGFKDLDLDKLMRLKHSGVLDQ